MQTDKLTCDDLDAVGVYFITGKVSSPIGNLRVKVCAGCEDDFSLHYVDLSQAVYFEDAGMQTRVYYSCEENKGQMLIDCTIDNIEEIIASSMMTGKTCFVRMGNYYIVNHNCLCRIDNKDKRLLLCDINHCPIVIEAPEKPSGREYDEYHRLMSNYSNQPLGELSETQPGLVSHMVKFKRYRSFETSLVKYRELILAHYGE